MPGKFFEKGSRDFEATLGRLIGIGCCSESNFFARFYLPEFLSKQISRVLLDEDLLLKLDAVAHFHELVRVARIAVFAGEFASAVGIDRPSKRHADAGAAVEEGTDREGEILDLMTLAQRFAVGGEARNSDELRA